jgi:hypothetical protein
MLDLCAARDDGCTDGVFVRVYERAQPSFFASSHAGVELFLR